MTYSLQLKEEEVNFIINVLAKEPYNSVYGLINKISNMAQQQLLEESKKESATTLDKKGK